MLSIVVFAGGCGKKVAVAPLPRSAESHFTKGLADFHKGTPESYRRAADEFRTAARLKPGNCEFALNLAQSLLFLSAEQILNWEEFGPSKNEAATVVDAKGPDCIPSGAFSN